jgi:hypothetical protein
MKATLTTFIMVAGAASSAWAQLLVSTTGSDSGNCSGSPCRTFRYALIQAGLNAMITAQDSGDFTQYFVGSGLHINKSIVIDGNGDNWASLQRRGV